MKPPAYISPLPRSLDAIDTKQGYRVTYLQSVKIFHKTSNDAVLAAENIAGSIRKQKWAIPLLNENGTASSESIILSSVNYAVAADKVASIDLEWDQVYPFS